MTLPYEINSLTKCAKMFWKESYHCLSFRAAASSYLEPENTDAMRLHVFPETGLRLEAAGTLQKVL